MDGHATTPQGILKLKVPNRFIASYMEQHFVGKIKIAALNFLKELKKIKIESELAVCTEIKIGR